MKKILIFCAVVSCTSVFVGCSKDTANVPSSKSTASYLVLKEWSMQSGNGSFDEYFYFLDLGADDNNNKKYMKTKRLYANSDSLQIIQGPELITGLADNWPAQVKTGCSNQWITDFFENGTMRLTQNGINGTTGKRVYKYGPIGIGYTFPYGAPEGETSILIPDGVGGSERTGGYFYFKQGIYIDNLTLTAKDLSSIVPGANAYDWKNVDNVYAYLNSPGFWTNVFIDYKNWRYFKFEENCDAGPTGNCTHRTLKLYPYQSLDKLMKWPDGWKKK